MPGSGETFPQAPRLPAISKEMAFNQKIGAGLCGCLAAFLVPLHATNLHQEPPPGFFDANPPPALAALPPDQQADSGAARITGSVIAIVHRRQTTGYLVEVNRDVPNAGGQMVMITGEPLEMAVGDRVPKIPRPVAGLSFPPSADLRPIYFYAGTTHYRDASGARRTVLLYTRDRDQALAHLQAHPQG